MGWNSRTPGEAWKLIKDYEQLNKDLPDQTVRPMAVFVVAPKVGKDALQEIFERDVGQTPYRHRSWLWWNAMRLSGTRRFWESTSKMRNEGTQWGDALSWMQIKCVGDEWREFSRRMGVPVTVPGRNLINPHRYPKGEKSERRNIWTKGGTWWKGNNFTKLLLQQEHLPPRPPGNDWTERLGPQGVRKIERELMNLIDPDKILQPDAKTRAVDYARSRIPEILGYKVERASRRTAAWFFQEDVPDEDSEYFFEYRHPENPPRRKTKGGHRWTWTW